MGNLPKTIKPYDLVVGQRIQIRQDFTERRATIYEGVVETIHPQSVSLEGSFSYGVVDKEGIKVTLTLLADPVKPKYEIDTLADVTFSRGHGATGTARCWWNGGEWIVTGTGFRYNLMAIEPKDAISVTPLRIAGPEDVLIPVKDGVVNFGSPSRTKHVHEVVADLTGGLGDDFSIAMAKLFCPEVDGPWTCCRTHGTHANPHTKCILR
jgi:hypothetical protein